LPAESFTDTLRFRETLYANETESETSADAAGPWTTVVVVTVAVVAEPASGALIVTAMVVVPTVVGVTVKLMVPVPATYETVAATPPTLTVMLDATKLAKFGPERTKVLVALATFVWSAHVPTVTAVGSGYGATATGPATARYEGAVAPPPGALGLT
jgi:hypothetical protein